MDLRKWSCVVVMCCLILSSLSFALSGSGTSGDPYVIANRSDFDAFCDNSAYWAVGTYTRLDVDVDLTGTTYTQSPISPDTVHNGNTFNGTSFTGYFNGNGHRIIGLTIDSYDKDYVALFGRIGTGGVVERLGVENCDINTDSDSTHYFTGGVCGYNAGTIRYCYSTGRVISSHYYTGGLCGESTGTLADSYSLAACRGSGSNTGGFCGEMVMGNITRCYSAGEVGYIGDDGGLIGYYINGTITSSFWDIKMSRCETSGGTTGFGGTGLTNDQMRTQSSFTDAGWDFGASGIWKMSHASGSTNGYPMLWWQTDNPDTSLTGGGVSTNPFIITSRANFDAFCANSNYWNDCIRLDADLSLSGTTYSTAPIAPDTADGTTETFNGISFAGIFDGNTHTISGLTIVGGTNCHLGLFGCIRLGEVKNLTISQCNVSGDLRNIGGLCGAKLIGVISNCSVNGTISGDAAESENIGGLCGYVQTLGAITDCTVNVAVSGKLSVGGLIGKHSLDGTGTLANCSASGTASGTYQVGGLCGLNSYAPITDCSADAAVTGVNSVGGFCGFTSGGGSLQITVSGCSAAGDVNGTGDYIAGFCGINQGIIADCYATGDVTGGTGYIAGFCGQNWNGQLMRCYAAGLVTAAPGIETQAGFCAVNSVAATFPGTSTECFWNTQTSGTMIGYTAYDAGLSMYVGHPSEAGVCVGITSAQMRQQTTFTAAGWDFVGETANGTDDIWKMPMYGTNNDFPILNWMSETPFAGSGTLADPYIIDTRAKFDTYAANSAYWTASVRLDCHLDLSDTTYTTAPIAPDTNEASAGFQGTKFTGHFDGNRHRITGLKIAGGSHDYLGLFGYLETGSTVKNLDLRMIQVAGSEYIGGLCGYNKGTVESCSVISGTVVGGSYTGGMVGGNFGSIQQCESGCAVTGNDYTGGMTGWNDYYGSIGNSYVTGNCTTYDESAGGFVGLNDGSIVKCYVTGTLTASEEPSGAFCGDTNGSGTVADCYYDSANGTDVFATGVTAPQLIVRSTFVGWDFTGSIKDGIYNIWDMPFWTNQSRPILSWQIDVMDIIDHWLGDESLCDLNGDGTVNLTDFAIHSQE